jgi:N-acetyl-anhydromuramyl-L-alanine amidase AmpD
VGLSRRHILLALLAAASLAAPSAHAAEGRKPKIMWLNGDRNYTPANRAPGDIHRIVIHVTEGRFWGTVFWFENPDAEASANFVVSRAGTIAQLVDLKDVAWHAGNRLMNEESVGIEHVGVTDDPAGFTRAEYQGSARLVAWLCRRSLIPIDREHIIGHSEVPGADHTDPGRYWNWAYYLKLVRRYAHPTPPIRVDSATLYRNQTITGKVPWRVETEGPVARVDFVVDGEVLWRDHRAPFSFAGGRGWNTLAFRNGRYDLLLRAVGKGGAVATKRLSVRVRNRRFELTTAGIRRGQSVMGIVPVRASLRGARSSGLRAYVDGRLLAVDSRAPFRIRWNTRKLRDGRHTLDLRARAVDGRTVHRRIRVRVVNAPILPKPQVVGGTLSDGQTVQGLVDWKVFVKRPVERVEFLVDGEAVGRSTAIPYGIVWDATTVPPGPHDLVARVVGKGGTVEVPVSVTVAG